MKPYVRALTYPPLFSDLASLTRFCASGRRRGRTVVRLRALAGRPFVFRSGTTDRHVLYATFFHRFHVVNGIDSPRTIVDLGSNIGSTMAHFATLYPSVRVIGVELDSDNAALCAENVRAFGSRCRVVNAAIWDTDGTVAYSRNGAGEDAYEATSDSDEGTTVPAISVGTLLRNHGVETVDLLKMDIEGAERRVLNTNTTWAESVKRIIVETHLPYATDECVVTLRRLGFETELSAYHPWAVIGRRP